MNRENRYELLGAPTSEGYVLAKDHFLERIVIMQERTVLHVTRLTDLWVEYPQGTHFYGLKWLCSDRLLFFSDGCWGAMNTEGIVTIPAAFEFIIPYLNTGYFIVKDKLGKCGCVDKDFKMLYPCEYEYKELRKKLSKDFYLFKM